MISSEVPEKKVRSKQAESEIWSPQTEVQLDLSG
jgi:hypothetical protein